MNHTKNQEIKEYLCINNMKIKFVEFVKGNYYDKWCEPNTRIRMVHSNYLFWIDKDIFDEHFVYYPTYIHDKIQLLFD
jgi:hypothetical protein